ncbi:MAG: hypothetical protein OEV66_04265 [Spirochaetia bacterium]|nr:hypothetical protein [Spirochaetia bacterium]
MKKTVSFLFLTGMFVSGLFSDYTAQSINLPTYPIEPGYPDTKDNKKTVSATESQVRVEIIVILGTGDEVRGYIFLPPRITFRHYKNGLNYEKTIQAEELQSLSIREYSKKEGGGANTKTVFYQFEPSSIDIKLNDSSTYRLDKIFQALRSFVIETSNGRTKLYTIFGDTYEKGKGWQNAESKDMDYHKNKPHPESVKKIIFIRVDREN